MNRVRFYPAPGAEQAMVGGQFSGSNVGPSEGFEAIATIASAPAAKQWTELAIDNHRIYRWLRYVGPPGSYGKIAEVEFLFEDAQTQRSRQCLRLGGEGRAT